ncbi:hypothetical protein [Romboutsia lituseburensis]|nr:hypothetical protein [Romboutsia lituseburensis]
MFKLICNKCGSEETIETEYRCNEDSKFTFTTFDGDIFIECKECHKEIKL